MTVVTPPKRLRDIPEYVAYEEKGAELRRKRRTAELEIEQLETEVNDVASRPGNAALDAAALAELEGTDAANESPEAKRVRLGVLRRKVEILDTAIAMHSRQHDQLRGKLSSRITSPMKPVIVAAIVEQLKHAVEAGKARNTETTLRESWDHDGVYHLGAFPVVTLAFLGAFDVADWQSGLCYTIREAIEHGYITGNEDWLKGVAFRV